MTDEEIVYFILNNPTAALGVLNQRGEHLMMDFNQGRSRREILVQDIQYTLTHATPGILQMLPSPRERP
jgi:hypothetical protein